MVVVEMRLIKEQFRKGNFKFFSMEFNRIPTYVLRAKARPFYRQARRPSVKNICFMGILETSYMYYF